MTNRDILIAEINRLMKTHDRVLVALDGRCGSGKTTLAGEISDRIGCAVVHMDDFFLRPEQRTPERYAQPGENIDHERFLREVLQPLRCGQSYVYQPFACSTMSLGEKTIRKAQSVTIIEGSYACHSSLWDYYDLHVFLTVSPAVQIARIRGRCGAEGAAVFVSRWILLEERYFSAFSVEQRCELRLTGD